ncbi:penicillin-binding protein 1B [Arenicella sp. 4NH20-0111]|uniref:penicillin-binding protein 1B n=1 Tax=Arenicella sp. 4NH20-0111 TaxID=3127648 RepID=UPI003104E5C1
MTDRNIKKASKKKTRKKVVGKKVSKKVTKKAAKRSSANKGRSSKRGSVGVAARTKGMLHTVGSGLKGVFWRTILVLLVIFIGYTAYLDVQIREQFEGQKWALPAHVYTRPMELYVGQLFDVKVVESELEELGYLKANEINRVGTYRLSKLELAIHQRAFRFWDEARKQQITKLSIRDGRVSSINVIDSIGNRTETEIVRLEPRLFGSVSPMKHEDRTLVHLDDVPQALIDALIAYEDRQYYSHFGVNFKGLARVAYQALTSGRVRGGGSSLTQQLVKNYYLSSERTVRRKVVEMIMAVLLEVHYTKDEILQAYINEVNLGQAGNRAIHGFGLASRYYYGRPLGELSLSEIATLVAINNAPSRYNPLRRPERVVKKRDVVLSAMLSDGKVDQHQFNVASSTVLGLSPNASRAATLSYPSFLGYVRENLRDGYQQEDLHSEGLRIHTTLDPRIQSSLEQSVAVELSQIEKSRKMATGQLQTAAVVIRTDNGEVVAMLGDRNPSFAGYNRALKAQRPVGSLLKPFVFLTALEQPEVFSLASYVQDKAITVKQKGSVDWNPKNYDGLEHGDVMLLDALANSYNLATVNVGMQLGLDRVADTLQRAGHDKPIRELPSMLLGAVPMTVLDVGRLYLTLASGGFKTPVKSVRSVLSQENVPLARYALDIEQAISSEYTHLINYALQDVVRNGTGRSVLSGFKYDYGLAGKTGTTNDYRDSWFAGFSGNYLTVVWVGRDDNRPTGLTGASGAARVWSRIMRNIPQQRLELSYSEQIVSQEVFYSEDPLVGDCELSRTLPMLISSLEMSNISCAHRMQYDQGRDEQRHFEPAGEEQPIQRRKKKKSFWKKIFG